MVMEYQIVNLVASANLNATLDLYNLAVSVPNIEYEPEQFPGLVYKLPEAKATFLLFSNGKVVCTGTKSEKIVEQAKSTGIIEILQKPIPMKTLIKTVTRILEKS